VRLGAPYSGFADVVGIKRSGSTVGSTHRGPSMALGGRASADDDLFKKRDEGQEINFRDERAGQNAKRDDNYAEIPCSYPLAFKLQLLQVHARLPQKNTILRGVRFPSGKIYSVAPQICGVLCRPSVTADAPENYGVPRPSAFSMKASDAECIP